MTQTPLNPHAQWIPSEDPDIDIKGIAGDTLNEMSVGGMVSKIQAAQKASHFGVPTLVANGTKEKILYRILKGEEVGTLILPKGETLSSRKHWIAYSLKPRGDVVVDEGAKKAIVQKGTSLLPSGIVEIRGSFERGDMVSCLGPRGKEFARGLVNYSASELKRIRGLRTEHIEKSLGYKYSDEVIHRDDWWC
jgi:glutamate 5-kinase